MKRLLAILLCVAMFATMFVACAPAETEVPTTPDATEEGTETTQDPASDKQVHAIVIKSAGNPYNEREATGFEEVVTAAGHEAVISRPEAATADAQVAIIQSLISQGVDSISIAANDENALQASLEEAMEAGIKVSCIDSKANADSRQVFVNQAGTEQIGQTLMDAILDLTGGEGQWAILSATSQAGNQNAWIDAMKSIMTDSKYAGLELVEVAYGDDEP